MDQFGTETRKLCSSQPYNMVLNIITRQLWACTFCETPQIANVRCGQTWRHLVLTHVQLVGQFQSQATMLVCLLWLFNRSEKNVALFKLLIMFLMWNISVRDYLSFLIKILIFVTWRWLSRRYNPTVPSIWIQRAGSGRLVCGILVI